MPQNENAYRPITEPAPAPPAAWTEIERGEAVISMRGVEQLPESLEANVIARGMFAPKAKRLAGIDYAIEYRLADGYPGGDVIDVYSFDNGSLALTAVDVEGRGVEAATLAALCKFGLRAYASAGMTPEFVVQHLDRLYLENSAFANVESFASVFFAHVDANREIMGYCSAGHDVVFLARPDEMPVLLPVTAPVIGVFEDQKHLFKQRYVELTKGTVLVLGTDGITEARDASGAFFGTDGLASVIERHIHGSMHDLANAVMDGVLDFTEGRARDDIAVLALRFA